MRTAEYYVFLFVDCYANAALNDELVVLGPHLNGLLVDFLGEIPQSSNFKSDAVGWRADRLRRVSKDFGEATRLLSCCTDEQRTSLCQWAYLKDRQPDGAQWRLRTKEDVAKFLHISIDDFKQSIRQGYDRINAQLGVFVA